MSQRCWCCKHLGKKVDLGIGNCCAILRECNSGKSKYAIDDVLKYHEPCPLYEKDKKNGIVQLIEKITK